MDVLTLKKAEKYTDSKFAKGKNLFKGDFTNDFIVSVNDTIIEPSVSVKENTFCGIVEIEEDETYTITKLLGGNRFVVALVDEKPTADNIPMNTLYVHRGESSEAFQSHTFTNTYGAKYLVFLTNYNFAGVPNVQVEKGDRYTGYEPFVKTVIPSPLLKKSNKNLFNGAYVPAILGRGNYDLPLAFVSRNDYIKAKLAIIPIEPNETYTISLPDGDNDRFRVATHDAQPTFSITANEMPANTTVYDSVVQGDRSYLTFTNNATDKYLFVYVHTSSDYEPRLQVERGFQVTEYEPYNVVGKEFLPSFPVAKNHYLMGRFDEYYTSPPEEGVGLGADFELRNSVIDDIYAVYDDIVLQNPNLVTKKLLGYGGDTNNEEDLNLPIYEYHFKTPKGQNRSSGKHVESPTILIITGLHGDEKSTCWSLARFMSQLVNNWQEQENLAAIFSNVDIKIIPVANPGGYNANTRRNLHDVDLNRNFSYLWEETVVTTQPKGDAPYSELETQILRNWMIENNNALAFIDYHNAFNPGHSGYLSTSNQDLWTIYSSLSRQWTVRWNKKYGLWRGIPETTVQMHITNDQLPMAFHEAIKVGITYSALLEVSKFYEVTEAHENEYSAEVIERGIEVIANYILALLNAYSKGVIN